MISIIANTNFILTVLFLVFATAFFVCDAYKKRDEPKNAIGDFVSAYFLASAIILIWGR